LKKIFKEIKMFKTIFKQWRGRQEGEGEIE
jgi:hypothetical protein